MLPLPIDGRLDQIVDTVRRRRAVVIVAEPGAGKTTRVPPALTALGPVGVLQPRRVAARSLARRVADEQGWTLGRESGWHVRNDRRFSDDTRVLFMTEGILAARLQRDPLAEAFAVIVLDEFHERTIHADVALAMSREAWRARTDLALVVMSATLDARAVATYLDDAAVIEVEGRRHPLTVTHEPDASAASVAAREIRHGARAVLCFLPGAREIRQTLDALAREPGAGSVDALPLHGGLPPAEQDRALDPGDRPRVIAATNISETSLTVPDVTVVIDAGLQRVSRYDRARGIDVLTTERITRDAADQRAGRAGRVGPGRAIRLWDERDRLRPHREPEILRVDLAPVVLTLLAWGGNPRAVAWLDAPPEGAVEAAFALLEKLGAVDTRGRITPLGLRMRDLPMHPRLARILLDAGGAFDAAAACAILAEPQSQPRSRGRDPVAGDCDLLPLVDDWRAMPQSIRHAADELMRAAGGTGARIQPRALRHALFAGFADRLARRREPHGRSLLLVSGSGATLAAESGVVNAEFLVCLDVLTTGATPLVRMASAVDREWLTPNREEIEHVVTSDGAIRAARVEYIGAIAMASRPVAPDPLVAGDMLAQAWLRRRADDERAVALRSRLAFAGIELGFEELVKAAAAGASSLADIDIERALPYETRTALESRAPDTLRLPSGRSVRLEYRADGTVFAAARLQELFGLLDTPRVGTVPVTFELLSPAGRPVQVTQDLASFWRRGYPEVRKELRARYPRHAWPEDPLTAPPTSRPKPRVRRDTI